MEITHGMYNSKQPEKVFMRKFKKENIRLTDGTWKEIHVRDYSHEMEIPEKFLEMLSYIATKCLVFDLDFSIAREGELLWAISIVHPRDQFCKKTAKKILTDRMKWMINLPSHEQYKLENKRWSYHG